MVVSGGVKALHTKPPKKDIKISYHRGYAIIGKLEISGGANRVAFPSVIRQDGRVPMGGVLRMRYADLSPSIQLLSYGLLAAVLAAFLTRVVVFFHRDNSGARPQYPSAWSAAQCRVLECFRQLIGLALIPPWVLFLFILPSMPTNWPFGYLALISLLLLSHAWVLLLVPRRWKTIDAFSPSFWLTITFLVVWWGAMFTATGWMFANASASPPLRLPPVGVFAVQGVPPSQI